MNPAVHISAAVSQLFADRKAGVGCSRLPCVRDFLLKTDEICKRQPVRLNAGTSIPSRRNSPPGMAAYFREAHCRHLHSSGLHAEH